MSAPDASENGGEGGEEREEGGKHLIILLHGVLGAASDWDNWVKVWMAEVQRRNGIAPASSPVRKRSMKRMSHRLHQLFKADSDSESSQSASQATYPEKLPGWERALQAEFYVVELKELTLRGIEYLAIQSCNQVERFLSRRPRVFQHFSVIGHSFGGIYSKYLLSIRQQYAHFASLVPKNFISLASPHLSSCTSWNRVHVELVGRLLLSTTGKEMLLEDEPLLLLAATRNSIPELQKFANLMAYSNMRNDVAVPYGTGIIHVRQGTKMFSCTTEGEVVVGMHRPDSCQCFADSGTCHHPSSFSRPMTHEGESGLHSPGRLPSRHMTHEHHSNTEGPHRPPSSPLERGPSGSLLRLQPKPKLPTKESSQQMEYIWTLFRLLDDLPWTRVDVSISHVRAHEFIILKPKWTNKGLREVIHHVLDNFVF